MRTTVLLSTAAAILMIGAGAGTAAAQTSHEGSGRAPAAQQNAPAEKMAPSMHSGKSSETTGQGATEAPNAKSAPKGAEEPHAGTKSQSGMDKNNTTGAAPKSDMDQ